MVYIFDNVKILKKQFSLHCCPTPRPTPFVGTHITIIVTLPFQEPQSLVNGGGHHQHHPNMMPNNMYTVEEYIYPDLFYPYDQTCARPFSSGSSCSSSNESDRMLAHQAGAGGYTPPAAMLMAAAGHDDQHAVAAAAYQTLTPVGAATATTTAAAPVGHHHHHHGVIVDTQHYAVVNEYVHWWPSPPPPRVRPGDASGTAYNDRPAWWTSRTRVKRIYCSFLMRARYNRSCSTWHVLACLLCQVAHA